MNSLFARAIPDRINGGYIGQVVVYGGWPLDEEPKLITILYECHGKNSDEALNQCHVFIKDYNCQYER